MACHSPYHFLTLRQADEGMGVSASVSTLQRRHCWRYPPTRDGMKSEAAATSACRALVGDGAKQADWLTDVIPSGTSVQGKPTMHGFECTVTDVNHQYSGFDFVQTKERLDYEVRDAQHSTSTPEKVASAWNAGTQVGVYSESVSEGKSQTATQDMQTIVAQVGQ